MFRLPERTSVFHILLSVLMTTLSICFFVFGCHFSGINLSGKESVFQNFTVLKAFMFAFFLFFTIIFLIFSIRILGKRKDLKRRSVGKLYKENTLPTVIITLMVFGIVVREAYILRESFNPTL
jgi:uncharacterized membrane protein